MGSREFSRWAAFYQLEPWGEERADWRVAQVAAIQYAGTFKKNKRVSDFMWKRPGFKMSTKDITAKQKALEMQMLMAGVGRRG